MFYQVFLVVRSAINDKYNLLAHKIVVYADSKDEAKQKAYNLFVHSEIIDKMTLISPLSKKAIYIYK